jgi:DNA-binding transcriptional ArsR family regulator
VTFTSLTLHASCEIPSIFLVTQVIVALSSRTRARFFSGLADPARLALLDALRHGELTAGDASLAAGLSPSNASKHLACLRHCGLVESRQEWRRVYYPSPRA